MPVLFLANKKDLPTALSPVEIAQVRLGGVALRRRPMGSTAVGLWPWRAGGRGAPTSSPDPACGCVSQALQLEEIKDRPWQIVPTNALDGEGLERGMEWLAEKLKT